MTVCILDTSILDELLNVPGWANQHDATLADFAQRSNDRHLFLLPIAVLFETGNHIAQLPDGDARRKRAEAFVALAHGALSGDSPFVPTPLPDLTIVATWLDDFPGNAMRGIGLADRSLIALWEAQRALQPHRRVYIWSLDAHLSGHDTGSPK